MAEKKRYGVLEMDEETKRKLDREIRRQPFHRTPLPEIREMLKEVRKSSAHLTTRLANNMWILSSDLEKRDRSS